MLEQFRWFHSLPCVRITYGYNFADQVANQAIADFHSQHHIVPLRDSRNYNHCSYSADYTLEDAEKVVAFLKTLNFIEEPPPPYHYAGEDV